jgi:acetyl-CoA C-acetyltransferase
VTTDAFVVSAVRTPVGRRNGILSGQHPVDLAGLAIAEAVRRAGVPGDAVDDVILGCVGQIGAQAFNIARTAALAADLPEAVPGTTIDRQCGSSQQAVHFASQAIRSGDQDIVVAGGVEIMSLIPLGAGATVGEAAGLGHPRGGAAWSHRYGDVEISQFNGAELIARHWDVSREDMERFALESHRRAIAAIDAGHFAGEIFEVAGAHTDEGPRRDSTLEKMATLKTLLPDGRMTAAVASQVSDGAAALVLASADAVRRFGLSPLARIHTTAVVGSDPVMMLSGPIPATRAVLDRAGLKIDEIDRFEVNEAFAPVVLAWLKETGADPAATNPDGGAIALGHPLGATGARLMTSLIHGLRRNGQRFGLQTMCEGGGMANATIVERL